MKNVEKMLLDYQNESFFSRNKKYIFTFLTLLIIASVVTSLVIILPNINDTSSSTDSNNSNSSTENSSFPNASETNFSYFDLGNNFDPDNKINSSYLTINYGNWIKIYSNISISDVYIKDSKSNTIATYDTSSLFDIDSNEMNIDVDEKNLFEYGKKYYVYISLFNSNTGELITQQISSSNGTSYIQWTFNNVDDLHIYPDNFGLRMEGNTTKILIDESLFYGSNSKILDLSIYEDDTGLLIETQTEDNKTVLSDPDNFYSTWQFEFTNIVQGKDYYVEITFSYSGSSKTKKSVPFTQKDNIVDEIYYCSPDANLDSITYDKSNINQNLKGYKEFNIANTKPGDTVYSVGFDDFGNPTDVYNVALPTFWNDKIDTFKIDTIEVNRNYSFFDMFQNFIDYTKPKNKLKSQILGSFQSDYFNEKSLQTCYNPKDGGAEDITYVNMFDFNYFNFSDPNITDDQSINNYGDTMKYWINNNYTIFNHTLPNDGATIRYPSGSLNNANGLSANKFEFKSPIQLEFGMTNENGDGKSFLIDEVSKLYVQTSNYSTNITGQQVNLDIIGLANGVDFNYQTYTSLQTGSATYSIFDKTPEGNDIATDKSTNMPGIDGIKLTDQTPLIYNFYIEFDNKIRIEIQNANLTQITDVEHLNYWTIDYKIV